MNKFLLIGCTVLVGGCTSVQIKPINLANNVPIQEVCIVNNPQVEVPNFQSIVDDRIRTHGIRTKIINNVSKNSCPYKLYYSARRSWDFVTYLSWAELKLYKDSILVGSAEYKLRGKGGLSLMKWQSVETKMNPVVDELFSGKGQGQNKLTAPEQEQILIPKTIDRLN